MKNSLFVALAVLVLGCNSVVVDETGDSSPGSDDTTDVTSSSTVTGSSSSASSSTSTTGSGGASASSSSAVTTGSGGNACTPQITATALNAADGDVALGTQGFRTLSVKFEASDCADVLVTGAFFALWNVGDPEGLDTLPYCADPCSVPEDYNFVNVQLRDSAGVSVTGPSNFGIYGVGDHVGLAVQLSGDFTVAAGSSLMLDLVLDVVNPPPAPDQNMAFQVDAVSFYTETGMQSFDDETDADAAFTVVDLESKLKITLDPETPESHIVVGGLDAWDLFSQYQVWNFTTESQVIDAIEIAQADPNGDAADFDSIEVEMDGFWCFTGNKVILAGGEQHFYLDSTNGPGCTIAPNATGTMQVWAKMANVVSSAACPSGHGCARSGHTDGLRIENMHVASDPDFFAQAPWEVVNPPSMVLRKSEPIVSQLALSSTTLANINQDLAKWQVAANSGGSITWKLAAFHLTMSDNVQLSMLRLSRGAVDLDPAAYSIFAPCTDSACTTVKSGMVYVMFKTEESISGSGNVYTLHGTVSGAVSGESIRLDLDRAQAEFPATGQLIYYGAPFPILRPDPWYPPQTPSEFTGTFLWSDMSEQPHTDQWATDDMHRADSFSSLDWTNDAWLDMPDMSWTLSL